MKSSILFVFNIFCLFSVVFSQIQSGVINYSVSSDWSKMNAAIKYMPKAQEESERMNYVWGADNMSNMVYADLTFNDSIYSFSFKEKEDDRWSRASIYNIYRDYLNNISYDFKELLGKKYFINDTIIPQKWRIKNNMKEIAGHMCMDAEYYDTIKEQLIVAWFALDMPLSIGPDIYCGLPGVILEINKCDGAMVYTAVSITSANENLKINKPERKKRIKEVTFAEYDKLVWEKYQECKKLKRPYTWTIGF